MHELFRAIPKVWEGFEEKPELREAFVFAAWRKIAGASLREHTAPYSFFKTRLIIAVTDRMWKRHLELLSGQMIYKINASLNQETVAFIEFRIDEETVNLERSKYSRKQVSDEKFNEIALEKITPDLRNAADSIKDDNLRYQFLLAAGGCLARKEKLNEKAKQFYAD